MRGGRHRLDGWRNTLTLPVKVRGGDDEVDCYLLFWLKWNCHSLRFDLGKHKRTADAAPTRRDRKLPKAFCFSQSTHTRSLFTANVEAGTLTWEISALFLLVSGSSGSINRDNITILCQVLRFIRVSISCLSFITKIQTKRSAYKLFLSVRVLWVEVFMLHCWTLKIWGEIWLWISYFHTFINYETLLPAAYMANVRIS